MNRNNLKDPRREDFNYNTIALPFFGFFNETTLSWQLKVIPLKLFYYQTFFDTWRNEHP